MLVAFVLSALALTTDGTLQLVALQSDRSTALSPSTAAGGRSTGLQALESDLVTHRRWHGHTITRQLYAGDGSGPDIAGIPRVPAQGEYYASPALIDLIDRDDVVKDLFAGRQRVGVIGPSGLVHPHELRAIGAADPRSEVGLAPVTGFGDPPQALDDFTALNRAVAVLVILSIWVPGLTLLTMASRLAGVESRSRARSLHVVGVPRRTVMLLHGFEVGAFVLGGALLGAAAFHVWIRSVTRVPWTDAGYFTQDVDPGSVTTVGLVGIITLFAGISAGRAVDPSGSVDASPVLRSRPGRRRRRLRLPTVGATLVMGSLVYLLILVVTPKPPAWQVLGMWLADGALAVGLWLWSPSLVTTAFARLAPFARRGGTLVGIRTQSRRVSTSLRLGALLSAVIVLVIGALSFINVLMHGGDGSWDEALERRPKVPVTVVDIADTLTLRDVHRVAPEAGAVEQLAGRSGGRTVPVVIGGCDDLATLAGAQPDGCSGGPQWLSLTRGALPDHAHPGTVTVPHRGSIDAPGPSDVVTASSRLPSSWQGALLVPPDQHGLHSDDSNGTFFLLATNTELGQTLASVGGLAPLAQFRLGDLTYSDPYSARFPTQVAWLVLGTVVALGVGVVGLVTTIIGESREHSRRMRGLRTLGAPRTDTILAHVWTTAAPVVALGWLGVAAGLVVAVVMHTFDDRAQVEWTAALALAAATVVVALVATVVTLPSTLSTSRRPGGLDA